MAELLEMIRKAIRESGETPAAIAARAGLPRSALSRLLAGKSLTVEGAERVAAALGLKITLSGKRRKPKG